MTHSWQEYRKGKSYDEKLAHNLKLESYDVNKYFRIENGKW